MRKSILVTGASSGIGRATAIALAGPGVGLLLVGRRSEELDKVAAACKAQGASAESIVADLESLDSIDDVVARFNEMDGYPILINSAGIGQYAPFSDLKWSDIERQMMVNFLAPAKLIHQCLPLMLERGGGQIVNVLSMVCEHVLPGCGGYASSKSALQMLGKVVSAEYRSRWIRVTGLMPGAVATPIWDGSPMADRVSEMIPVEAVAATIRQLVDAPPTFNLDEILMMPPTGVL